MNEKELLPDDLQRAIREGDAVAFVGAGFTLPLGLPDWNGLLRRFLGDCKRRFKDSENQKRLRLCGDLIKGGGFTMAAWQLKQFYQDDRNKLKDHYWKWFSGLFGDTDGMLKRLGKKHPGIRKRMAARKTNLFGTPWRGIVTTNFDDFLDKSPNPRMRTCHGHDRTIMSILSRHKTQPGMEALFFVKLHGASWHQNMVFTEEDYALTYLMGSNPKSYKVPSFLNALMQSKQLVFIGCSIESRLLDIRRQLIQIGELPNAWALVPKGKADSIRRDMYEKLYGIKLITYPEKEGGIRHGAVDRFLQMTASLSPPLKKMA